MNWMLALYVAVGWAVVAVCVALGFWLGRNKAKALDRVLWDRDRKRWKQEESIALQTMKDSMRKVERLQEENEELRERYGALLKERTG